LTNVPIPVPIDRTIAWDSLCDAAGPIEVLATRGVIPLDYAGVAKALSGWFSGPKAATDWFSERPEALARLRRIRDLAKCDGRVSIGEFLGFSYLGLFMEKSEELSAFRYRSEGSRQSDVSHQSDVSRQSNLVLVNEAMHPDPGAAVEAVLGPLNKFEPVARR
jgi:hypothetical protein